MSLKADHSTLPKPARTSEHGLTPDTEPTFLQPYLDALVEANEADGQRPHAVEGTRFRHSMAGACARAVAYHALEVPESNPMDLAGIVVTRNGTAKHDEIQETLGLRLGDQLEVEVACQIRDFDGSGNADGLRIIDDRRVCWEHKNVGGFAFKMAVGERGAAQGPKHDHIVQCALNALALDADQMVITYMTWEAISVQIAARKKIPPAGRVCAQWTFERDEWEPIALAEAARVNGILNLLDEGTLPARKFADPELPAGHVLVDPATGRWELARDGQVIDTGTWWACGYCRWQTVCATTPAGRTPIADTDLAFPTRGAA